LIAVNGAGHGPEALKRVMEKENLPWRSFADEKREIVSKWNLSGTPTFYAIDHAGVIRHKWVGAPGEAALDLALEKLVGEAEDAARTETKK